MAIGAHHFIDTVVQKGIQIHYIFLEFFFQCLCWL